MTLAAPPPVTEAIVAFAAGAWAFRAGARDAARPLLLATILDAMAGADTERTAIGAAAWAPGLPRSRAHAIGRPAPASATGAAFLTALAADNAALATPVVAAALATGESTAAGGAVVLDAVIAGIDVAARLQRALGSVHAARGWDVRGTCGRIGAAIAAARILGLQRAALRDAIGIAATAAGGLANAAGTMTSAYIAASAAADGVEAALLARAEFSAAPLALEGRRGLATLMSDQLDASAFEGLGNRVAFGTTQLPRALDADERALRVRDLIARVERLPVIAELVAATMPA